MNRKLKPQPVKRAPQRFVRRGPLAKVRRAGLIILQASIGVWSPSTERYIRISDIWESQTMKSGIDYLTGEHWFAPPVHRTPNKD